MGDTVTLSLPNAMTRQIEQACRREHRTKSELMREALRVYFGAHAACPLMPPPGRNSKPLAKVARKSAAVSTTRSMSLHASLAGGHRRPRATKPSATYD